MRVLLPVWALVASLSASVAARADSPDWEDAEVQAPPEPSQETGEDGSEPPRRAPRVAPTLAGPEAQLEGAQRDLERVEQELIEVQRHTRAYFATWLIGHSALVGVSTYLSRNLDDPDMRGSFRVNVALSSGMLLYHLVQGWPALGSHRRFKRLPSSTLEEKVAKANYAESQIAAQLHKDHIATTIERHLGVLVAAVGLGLGVGFYFESIKEGLTLGVGVLAVGELVILSRPHTYHGPKEHGGAPQTSLAVMPMIDKHARGLGLGARF